MHTKTDSSGEKKCRSCFVYPSEWKSSAATESLLEQSNNLESNRKQRYGIETNGNDDER